MALAVRYKTCSLSHLAQLQLIKALNRFLASVSVMVMVTVPSGTGWGGGLVISAFILVPYSQGLELHHSEWLSLGLASVPPLPPSPHH